MIMDIRFEETHLWKSLVYVFLIELGFSKWTTDISSQISLCACFELSKNVVLARDMPVAPLCQR